MSYLRILQTSIILARRGGFIQAFITMQSISEFHGQLHKRHTVTLSGLFIYARCSIVNTNHLSRLPLSSENKKKRYNGPLSPFFP